MQAMIKIQEFLGKAIIKVYTFVQLALLLKLKLLNISKKDDRCGDHTRDLIVLSHIIDKLESLLTVFVKVNISD